MTSIQCGEGPVACDRTITGTHLGPLTVTSGVTCIADGTAVIGPVQVRPEAGLVVDRARLYGPVSTTGATLVELVGSQVRGPLTVSDSTGFVILRDNQLHGPVTLTGNTTGDFPMVVSGNSIVGPLSCAANDPAPVNNGDPNQVRGGQTGQCESL